MTSYTRRLWKDWSYTSWPWYSQSCKLLLGAKRYQSHATSNGIMYLLGPESDDAVQFPTVKQGLLYQVMQVHQYGSGPISRVVRYMKLGTNCWTLCRESCEIATVHR